VIDPANQWIDVDLTLPTKDIEEAYESLSTMGDAQDVLPILAYMDNCPAWIKAACFDVFDAEFNVIDVNHDQAYCFYNFFKCRRDVECGVCRMCGVKCMDVFVRVGVPEPLVDLG
jgi:hypothetical protein